MLLIPTLKIVFLLFSGVLKLVLLGALSTTVYSFIGVITIPPGVSVVLRSGFAFLVAFGDFLLKRLFYVAAYLSGYCFMAIKTLMPSIIKWINIAFSFSGWIAIRTYNGIMGFTDPMTGALSWIMLVGLIYLLIDRKLRSYNTPTVVLVTGLDADVTNITHHHDNSHTPLFDERNPVNSENEHRHLRQPENTQEDLPICHQDNPMETFDDDEPNYRTSSPRRQICSNHATPVALPEDDGVEQESNVKRVDSGEDSKIIMTEVLRRRLRSYNDMSLCIICCQEERNVAIFPCGHTSLCSECVHVLRTMTNKCPICKTVIEEERTIYL